MADRDLSPTARDPDDLVEDLIAECVLRMESEGHDVVEEVCARAPEVADAVRAGVRLLRDAGLASTTGAPLQAAADVPDSLGHFRILRRLGGGGMGVVFLAEDSSLGRRVALKVIRPDHLYFSRSRDRFRREAEAVARLRHPNIVPLYTFGDEDGVPYFAMEYVEGCTLHDIVRQLAGRQPEKLTGRDLVQAMARTLGQEPPPPDAELPEIFDGSWHVVCLRIALAVAGAIEHAHAQGVLHRDLKPSNLMVTLDGRVLVVDFGLARAEGSIDLTESGTELGSLAYMSPEQIGGRTREIGPATDVYALGVTLYEMLVLRGPYHADTSEETRRRIREGRPRPLRQLNRALSVDAETVCLKAMDLEPRRRYSSAAALAHDLGNVIAFKPVEARRLGPLLRVRPFAQRNPARFVLIVVLLLGLPLMTGLGGFLVASYDDIAAADRARQRAAAIELLERSYLEGMSGHTERAISGFERALQLWPDLPIALACLLSSYEDQDGDTTLADASRYAELMRRHPALRWFEVDGLRAAGRAEEADRLAATLVAPSSAIDWFVHGARAMDAAYQGDRAALAEALAAFRQAVWATTEPLPIFHFRLCECAILSGDLALVQELGGAIAAQWPDSATALAFAGSAFARLDDARSVAYLERACALDPELALPHSMLGDAAMAAGDHQAALDHLQTAIRLDPEVGVAWLALGTALEQVGKLDEAIDAHRRATECSPTMPPMWLALGDALQSRGDERDATSAYLRVAELEPRNPTGLVRIGNMHLAAERTDDAVEVLRRAVAVDGQSAIAHHDLGVALSKAGEWDAAIDEMRRAIELEPEMVLVQNLNLARFLIASGRNAEAATELRSILATRPDCAEAADMLEALR